MSQVSQTPSAARGAALETLLAGHFTRHGYAVESNLVVEGRSGNAHELDVVARRSDALTDYVTVVEAKSWSNRVGKEVVAKLAYVLADVGMHKGIIAAPGGLTSGAITAAEALGIEVWDGAELERRLGATALADAADGRGESRQPATLTVTGDHHRISQARATNVLKRMARGRFGMGGDSLVWQAALWLPVRAIAFRVADAGVQGRRHGSGTNRTRVVEVYYDGFSGLPLQCLDPCEVRLDVPGRAALAPLMSAADITRPVGKAMAALARVSTAAAVERHQGTLLGSGLPAEAELITVEHDELWHAPMQVGVLSRGDEQRAVVIDGRTGAAVPEYSHALTANFGAFRDRLS